MDLDITYNKVQQGGATEIGQDSQTEVLNLVKQSMDINNELIELMKINNIHLSLITGEEIENSDNR